MSDAHAYAEENRARFLEELNDLLRIPSVSADLTHHRDDVRRAADWLVENMQGIGLEAERIDLEGHHPLVFGQWLGAGDDAPTVLVYGHYDVQPAEMRDGWDTQPFEPVLKADKIFARGASDDKGQIFAHLKAAESMFANGGTPPVNLKYIFEGEEEVSSVGLTKFVPENKDKLSADVCVISDTALLGKDQPAVVYSLRGLSYFEMEVFGPSNDLHSGTYGGIVHNPVQAIAEIIAGLHKPDGSVDVPGFYDDVLELNEEERELLKETDIAEDEFYSATGAPAPWGEQGYTLRERVGARPTLEVHGIEGGFYGEGAKTVLPARALAKLSCRLVANQDPDQIYELVKARIEALTPATVRVEVRKIHNGHGAIVDLEDPALQAAVRAYEKNWDKKTKFLRAGGSIPIVADFQRELNLPVILLGFGLNTDGVHGPNEHFHIDLFYKAIDTIIQFMHEVRDLS